MPQPQALVPSIASTLEDHAQNYQGPPESKSTPSISQAQGSQSQSNPRASDTGRLLILCFDGTGNKFGENSNIVRLFRALKKGSQKHQVLYYQPGIGTYNKRAFITHTVSAIANAIDFAVARHLDDHVKDGYKFLIQNYMPGDKICLFGFSRGAHTARVVAGMIYKVGILPRENLQQVDFAFNIYMTTGYQGYKLSREFKLTFASHVDIDFVGVWDTVSSVGLIPQTHPYTSINYSVKCFRHALALDERRTRFRPNVWGEQTVDREQEIDVDLPIEWEVDRSKLDGWQYTAPERNHADVKEVWFTGSHSDVGGGSHPTSRSRSLSYVSLRWMIKECILAKTGIQFDMDYLRDDLDFDFDNLEKEMANKNITPEDLGEAYKEIGKYAADSRAHAQETELSTSANANSTVTSETALGRIGRHIRDIFDDVFDQLIMKWWFWWILEIIPMLTTYQDLEGNWIRLRMRNLGRGRYIPSYNNKVYVHRTVKERIENPGRDYQPKAHNWDRVANSPGMLEYVS
ncbi:hypothetical protein F5887DRAFT_1139000 [Amanita rubescens]|nr:hypothetical protein F5887DRAFT_900248 [Amanita rubescens]KAF8335139.1 hypothetical protein F5887DRAFT_1139000 [Amanita rubescens]